VTVMASQSLGQGVQHAEASTHGLPSVGREPIDLRDAESLGLRSEQCAVVRQAIDEPAYLAVPTRSRIDVGYKIVRAPIAAFALAKELALIGAVSQRVFKIEQWTLWLLFPVIGLLGVIYNLELLVIAGFLPPIYAAVRVRGGRGPASVVIRIPYNQLNHAEYNHVTGMLVFGDQFDHRIHQLRMTPLDGYKLLAHIHQGASSHA